ncbi:hypothetical protein OY671_011374, partial [Metschnikowia pulcherrima]
SFFSSSVSSSEHSPFGISYAVAASACVSSSAYYASHMSGGLTRGVPSGAGIASSYGSSYVSSQSEQTASVVGAIALFSVSAAVMVLTRKVNWYGSSQGGTPPRPTMPPMQRPAAPRAEAA